MPSLTPTKDLPKIVEGDDVDFPVTFTDSSGETVDITGWTVSFTIAERGAGDVLIQKTVTNHDDPTAGKTGFHLDPADTSGLSGSKRYDIQIEQADGTIKTIVLGTVAFIDGVTD